MMALERVFESSPSWVIEVQTDSIRILLILCGFELQKILNSEHYKDAWILRDFHFQYP